jgi:hypothetical protein
VESDAGVVVVHDGDPRPHVVDGAQRSTTTAGGGGPASMVDDDHDALLAPAAKPDSDSTATSASELVEHRPIRSAVVVVLGGVIATFEPPGRS